MSCWSSAARELHSRYPNTSDPYGEIRMGCGEVLSCMKSELRLSSPTAQTGPTRRLDACQQGVAAAVRLEDRGFAFAHVKPVFPEGIHDVRVVRYNNVVRARRQFLGSESPHH